MAKIVSIGLQERIDLHVVFFEAGANHLEGFIHGIRELKGGIRFD